MSFYSRSELSRVPIYKSKSMRAEAYHRKTASVRENIFLSHSHKDSDIVNQVIELLGNQGVSVYVDWKDGTMPDVTSPVTAGKIKRKIASCNKFVLLATNNALASRWVPWELGVADLSNTMEHVAVFPVVDPPHSWTGNEYIGIYSTIEKSNDGSLGVYAPGKNNGISLKQWILKT